MCLIAYPLFNDMAASIGRLLKLQDDVTWGQLHRRLVDGWGERTTVKKAVPRLVSSMVDWQVLEPTDARGHFVATPQRSTRSKRLQVWLLAAAHVGQGKELVEANELLTLPCLFPFKLTVSKADLRNSKDFELHRQGLDMDMVEMPNGQPKRSRKVEKPKQGVLFGDE
jgi:predicted small integral membrane protein